MSPVRGGNIFSLLAGKGKCVSFKLINVWVWAVTFTSCLFLCAEHSGWRRTFEIRVLIVMPFSPQICREAFWWDARQTRPPGHKSSVSILTTGVGGCEGRGAILSLLSRDGDSAYNVISKCLSDICFLEGGLAFLSCMCEKGKQQWSVLPFNRFVYHIIQYTKSKEMTPNTKRVRRSVRIVVFPHYEGEKHPQIR